MVHIQSLDKPQDSDFDRFHELLDELRSEAKVPDTFLTGPERKAWENPYDLVSINPILKRDAMEKAIYKLIEKVRTPENQ